MSAAAAEPEPEVADRSIGAQTREIGRRLQAGQISEPEAADMLAALQKKQGGAAGRQSAAQKRYENRRKIVPDVVPLRDVSGRVQSLEDAVRERFGLKGPVSSPTDVTPIVTLPHTWPPRLTPAEFDLLVIGTAVFARPKSGGSARPLYQLHTSQVLLRW